jgi:hypothetical protein
MEIDRHFLILSGAQQRRNPNAPLLETQVQAITLRSFEIYRGITDRERVEARVEAVCLKGCRQVRRDIVLLESGAEIPEAQGLAPDERRLLLAELKQIMAVYGDTCRID